MKYLSDFEDWALGLHPSWVGPVLMTTLLALLLFLCGALVYFTQGWVLLAFPALSLYALYVALFKQKGRYD